jgi:hypothetical protein
MGFLDKAKDALRGNKSKAKQGVDTAADQARKAAPAQHTDKVDRAADAAKKGIDGV